MNIFYFIKPLWDFKKGTWILVFRICCNFLITQTESGCKAEAWPTSGSSLDLLNNQSWLDDKDFPNGLLQKETAGCLLLSMWPLDGAKSLIVTDIWLLGGSPETVWYNDELVIFLNLDIWYTSKWHCSLSWFYIMLSYKHGSLERKPK